MRKYEIHLNNGEILGYDENSFIPVHQTLRGRFMNAPKDAILNLQDSFVIPVKNINYLQIRETEVKEGR